MYSDMDGMFNPISVMYLHLKYENIEKITNSSPNFLRSCFNSEFPHCENFLSCVATNLSGYTLDFGNFLNFASNRYVVL